MKTNLFRSRLGGALIAFSLLFGIAIASSATAQAQYRDDRDGQYRRDRDSNQDRDRDNRDRNWRRDRDRDRNNQNGNWRRDRDRRNDNYGNNGGYYGNNGGYYGNNGGYNNIYRAAQNQGYQDGLNTGANDANRGQSYSPQRSHYYRNATDGYNSSYGNRGQYQQAYRDGFVRGYNEGYRRYGGNNGGYNNNRRGSIFGNWFPFSQ